MGVPIVVVGKKHICPMSDGSKSHVGGTVTEGVNGVFIDGIPVAVKGSKCVCTGSPKLNSITIGSPGVFVDGEPVAIVGSMTEHGGVIIEGVPGVTISGSFPTMMDNPQKLEPRIFNLRWMKDKRLIQSDFLNEEVVFKASTVGFDEGDEVDLKLYNDEGELIIETAVNVKDGEIELTFTVEDGHFKQKEDDRQ